MPRGAYEYSILRNMYPADFPKKVKACSQNITKNITSLFAPVLSPVDSLHCSMVILSYVDQIEVVSCMCTSVIDLNSF